MDSPRICQRCSHPLPEHSTDGVCPSCGSAFHFEAETPKAQNTPRDADEQFLLGSTDPNPTGTHVPSTMAEERAPKARPRFVPPDIPNHTDFELIGGGGMGTVYRAIQRPTDRTVAVKVMHPMTASSHLRERFVNEVRAHARIRHPGVVPILEVGECANGPYFTMDYIAGGTLADRIKKGPLEAKDAVRLVADAADAVAAAHSEGIIHRDIKPSNILLDREGRVKVADFGLARHANHDDLTQTGIIVGTPSYMSPEQASGDPDKLTASADIYGLGATLYHLLTGRPPHKRGSTADTLRDLTAQPFVAPRTLVPGLCPILEAIVRKSLQREPADRYDSAAAFARELRNWSNGEPTIARPPTPLERIRHILRRHRPAVAIVASLLFMLAAAAVVRRESDPHRGIVRTLASGGTATIAPESGRPKWHKWLLGEEIFENSDFGDGSTQFRAKRLSLLALFDDPDINAYRYSIDLRQIDGAAGAGNPGGNARYLLGVFFGQQSHRAPSGETVDLAFTVEFNEFTQKGAPAVQKIVPRLRADTHLPGQAPSPKSPQNIGLATPVTFESTSPGETPKWRTVVLDVRPAGVAARWRNPDGSELPIFDLPAADLQAKLVASQATLDANFGVGTIVLAPWSPRQPFGIIGLQSTIAFKNATVQPLKE